MSEEITKDALLVTTPCDNAKIQINQALAMSTSKHELPGLDTGPKPVLLGIRKLNTAKSQLT